MTDLTHKFNSANARNRPFKATFDFIARTKIDYIIHINSNVDWWFAFNKIAKKIDMVKYLNNEDPWILDENVVCQTII